MGPKINYIDLTTVSDCSDPVLHLDIPGFFFLSGTKRLYLD